MRILLNALTLSCSLVAAATLNYSVVVESPGAGALYGISEDADGSLTTVGTLTLPAQKPHPGISYSDPFEYLASTRSAGEQMQLVRTDNQAEISLNRSIALPYISSGQAIVPVDDGYIVGGEAQNGQLALVHVGFNGELMYEKRFGTANKEQINRLIPLRDGGVLVIGTSMSTRSVSDPVYTQGVGKNDIYLARFDKHGMLIWNQKYGTLDDDTGIDAIEVADGSLIVAGLTHAKNTKELLLMRLDENGDTLWQHNIADVHSVHDLLLLRNKTLLLSMGDTSAKGIEQIRLMSFDMHRNILRDTTLNAKQHRELTMLTERSDGTILGVGSQTDAMGANIDAFAMRLNSELRPLWAKTFGQKNSDRFHAVTTLSDSSFGIVGTTTHEDAEKPSMWIVKLHEDGTIALKNTDASGIYDHLKKHFSKEIAAGEVVVTKDLTIQLTDPALYFPIGIYTLSATQNAFLERFGPKLLQSLAPYQRTIAQLQVNGHTSSEWKGADFMQGYINNMELSSRRAFSVLSHLFGQPATAPYRHWLTSVLRNDGNAYANVVTKEVRDGKLSRKVDFKIVLKEKK